MSEPAITPQTQIDSTRDQCEAGEDASRRRSGDLTTDHEASRPPIRHEPPPGFSIERELGRGGMGVVYLAWQRGLNRMAALKLMHSAADSKSIIRFLAESESIAAIRHPHVVEVYHFGEHGGQPYLALEYASGGSLDSVIGTLKRDGSEAIRDLVTLMAKIAGGVAAAHALGIVHRDLKPHNVLLTAAGEPKVTDFGLAKRGEGSDLTKTSAVMGTPAYMPPEQAKGDTKFVGPPADVWALGVILYELLTGRRPFEGADTWSILAAVQRGEFTAPRKLNAMIPKDLELIVLKCLSTEAHERYASAGLLQADLHKWLNGESLGFTSTYAVSRLFSSMERVRLQAHFKEDSAMFLALIPVMLLPEMWTTWILRHDGSQIALAAAQCVRVIAFLLVVGYYRDWHYTPEGQAERQLLAIWGGFAIASLVYGLGLRISHGHQPENILRFYLALSSFTAAAFLALAPTFWGYCALLAAFFFGTTLIMSFDLQWAPLEYGLAWCVVLAVISQRLKKLS